MNRLKRILAGLMTISCAFAAVSCGPFTEEGNNQNSLNTSQVQEMMQKSYKAIELDADLPFEEVDKVEPIGDTGNVLISGYIMEDEQYMNKTYITDSEFTNLQEIDLSFDNEQNIQPQINFSVTNSGKIFAIVTTTDYGDFEVPDFDDPDFDYENFDFDAMNEAAVTSYYIYAVDETGNVISKNEIKNLDKYAEEEYLDGGQLYIGQTFPLGDDKICLSISGSMEMTYVTVDADGNVSEPLDFGEDEYFYPYGTDINGNFVYITYDGTTNVLKTFDAATLSISPDVIKFEDTSLYFNAIMKGTGDYIVYLSSSTSLYGVKSDGTLEELINWVDSDLTGDFITGLIPVENGEFIITENNWTDGSTNIYRLTKRDASEIENVQLINMVVEYSDQEIIERVKDFNKTNGEYRIKVEDYNQYYVWDEETEKLTNSPDQQLRQDLATGKQVDIICMSGSSSIFSNLSNKGALVDLYEFLDKDEELSRDDILPPILSIGEHDGKLTTVSPSFYINTLACKTKFFDKPNWTVDEFIETCENLPEGMKPFANGNSKIDIFGRFIYGSNNLIDYDKAVCNFDSPEFIKILEFCNKFDNPGEGDEIDWENATDEEMNAYWEESESALRNDKALLSDVYLDNPRSYARALQAEFNDDITFVGNPSPDGQGAKIFTSNAYAIMESSNCKDVCWEFIKEIFSEENQSSDVIYEMPASKSAFTKLLDESMKKPYYTDENGKKVEYDDTYFVGDEEIVIKPLTQEQRDFIEDYILNAKPTNYYFNDEVDSIISEEVEAYFAGDKTAEQTAEIIQNRVSVLISEQS